MARNPKPKPKKKPDISLDDELRSLLHAYSPDAPTLLALGKPALERLLDASDGVFFPDYMDAITARTGSMRSRRSRRTTWKACSRR